MTAPCEKYKTYFVAIRDYLISVGMEKAERVQGAAPDAIRKTEEELGLRFPLAYKAWLEVFGTKASVTLGDYDTYTLTDLTRAYQALSKDRIHFTGWQNMLYMVYNEIRGIYTILGPIGEDPFVAFVDSVDDELTDDITLGNTFTGWVRKEILHRMYLKYSLRYDKLYAMSAEQIARFENKDWFITLLRADSFLDYERTTLYYAELKKFTAMIEAEDRAADHFTLPDAFQHRWVDYLNENKLLHLLDNKPD